MKTILLLILLVTSISFAQKVKEVVIYSEDGITNASVVTYERGESPEYTEYYIYSEETTEATTYLILDMINEEDSRDCEESGEYEENENYESIYIYDEHK